MRYEQFHIMLTDPEKYPDDCMIWYPAAVQD
jgi:hypothetical protein